ncbi:DUF2461 domain-containing protein [Sphingomonas sp. CLY1604]|uniref:DUF2461 domain-containing protein n=1 Tax=Sphingomonas sp. CLY1604 TaxID=3457786 RepID=UPI003FD6CC27
MIAAKTLTFLRELDDNNSKEWVDSNRDAYEAAIEDLTRMAARLIGAADQYDERIAGNAIDPRHAVSRLHRDMRFQKGKPPYKTDWFVTIGEDAQSRGPAGYYVHVQPGHCYAGGGVYTPPAPLLGKIRGRISQRYDEWRGIVEDEHLLGLIKGGLTSPAELKTMPRGFDADDPAAPYLRMKGFCANRPLTHAQIESDEGYALTIEAFKTARPLVDFINEAGRGR